MQSLYEYFKASKTKEKIEEFLEVNCIEFSFFETENTHQQFLIFQGFTQLIEEFLEGFIQSSGITQEELYSAMQKGLHEKRYRNLVDYLLSSDEFLIFKRRIVKVHMEIKTLTLEQLGPAGHEDFIRIDREQIFQQELKLAIEISLRIQEELEKQSRQEIAETQMDSVVEDLKIEREYLIKREREIMEQVRENLAERVGEEFIKPVQEDQLQELMKQRIEERQKERQNYLKNNFVKDKDADQTTLNKFAQIYQKLYK